MQGPYKHLGKFPSGCVVSRTFPKYLVLIMKIFHIRFYLTAYSLQGKEEKLLGIEGPFIMGMCVMCQELFPGLAIFLFFLASCLTCLIVFKYSRANVCGTFKDYFNEREGKIVLDFLDRAS